MKKTNVLQKKDKTYLWHPFTQMQDWITHDQLIIERGKSCYLYDTNGRKYIDGISSLWVTVHGHRKKAIDQAIQKQLKKVAHSTLLGLGNVPSIKLAEELVKIVPQGLKKVFFSDNGSTAVEIALKIAFQYQQQTGQNKKTKFLTLINAYHGDTIGSVSVGGMDLFHKIYKPLLFKTLKAPSPYCYRCKTSDRCILCGTDSRKRKAESGKPIRRCPCLQQLENIMQQHHAHIAAMIVEPMLQGAAGMLTMPTGYLSAIQKLCKKYGILLICDEVATGFGRTGKMFACQHENTRPDILCIAKGITGGYLPVAATLTTKKIFKAFLGKFEDKKTFFHGHTYTGNPLGCAAALANLAIFRQEKTLQQLQPKIGFLRKYLKKFRQLPHVGDIRQCGFMVGIELVKDKITKTAYPAHERMGHKVILEARKRGAILRPLGDTIILMPPLGITMGELEKLLGITFEAIEIVTKYR